MEIAIGVVGILVVVIGGLFFARQSDRAALPKAHNR